MRAIVSGYWVNDEGGAMTTTNNTNETQRRVNSRRKRRDGSPWKSTPGKRQNARFRPWLSLVDVRYPGHNELRHHCSENARVMLSVTGFAM